MEGFTSVTKLIFFHEGEGVMKVWLNGAISEEDVLFVGDSKWQD